MHRAFSCSSSMSTPQTMLVLKYGLASLVHEECRSSFEMRQERAHLKMRLHTPEMLEGFPYLLLVKCNITLFVPTANRSSTICPTVSMLDHEGVLGPMERHGDTLNRIHEDAACWVVDVLHPARNRDKAMIFRYHEIVDEATKRNIQPRIHTANHNPLSFCRHDSS